MRKSTRIENIMKKKKDESSSTDIIEPTLQFTKYYIVVIKESYLNPKGMRYMARVKRNVKCEVCIEFGFNISLQIIVLLCTIYL